MTTHRQAVLLRAGAAVVLAAGAIGGFATPAYAAGEPKVTIPADDLDWRVGDPPADLTATIENTLKTDAQIVIQIVLPDGLGSDVTVQARPAGCAANPCTIAFNGEETKTLTWKLTSPANHTLQQNQNKEGTGRIRASSSAGLGEDTYKVKVTGPSQAAPVTEVSGTVTDSSDATPIKDATVVIMDGANNAHETASGNNGQFRIVSTPNKPITAGSIKIGASKDGFETVPLMADGRSGQALTNQRVRLKPLAASATPQPEVTDTADPNASGMAESGEAEANTENASSGGPASSLSWVLIALGGLLVILGIGAIILLLRRRGDDDDEEDDADGGPPPPNRPVRRGPAPAGAGARPGGGPGGYRDTADPTMISRSPMGPPPGGRGNMNDATAIVRPGRLPVDEPYTMPTQSTPRSAYPTSPGPNGYGPPPGAAQSSYGPGQYGAAGGQQPGYGPTSGGGGYGGGYGPSSRPAADGYSASDYAGGGYGPAAGGYGPQSGAGYGPTPYGDDESTRRYDAGGYGPGAGNGGGSGGGYNGFEPQQGYGGGASGGAGDYGRNGYEPQRGGYEPAGGYDRDSYERVPEPRSGGSYDAGYDAPPPQPGYGGADYGPSGPPPHGDAPPARGGARRSLDWLDD